MRFSQESVILHPRDAHTLEKAFHKREVRLSANEFRGWYHATNRLANTRLASNDFRTNRRRQRAGNAALSPIVLCSPVTRLHSKRDRDTWGYPCTRSASTERGL